MIPAPEVSTECTKNLCALVSHLLLAFTLSVTCSIAVSGATSRPNILWITSEDHGPEMGCYGDHYASTPHVDRLAAKGMIYKRAWSGAPVCAPARTALISGMYPPSTGSEHMRSMVPFPRGKQMFPQLLRDVGYYCSNNAKEDYNLEKPGKVWDESSRKAHWRNRASGQPFFAVFNSEKSHESRIRTRPHAAVHDPNKVRLPPYHPDTPEVRRDWAQYYDIVSQADADAGSVLAQLDEDGLAEETIVFYFGDHGSGMPRSKRWPYNSGLHVPLIVYIPEKYSGLRPPEYTAGGKSERLVSFVDFGPTVLSLAGVLPPSWMQGRAFLGKFLVPASEFIHGFRGRMDERNDLVRSVSDGRYVYVRNYMPHLIYGQYLDYMWQTPTTRVWERLHREGKLTAVQSVFWNPKVPEELYDLENDPYEIKNLSESLDHQEIKKRLRKAQREHALAVRDLGFLPESELFERANGGSPYDFGLDEKRYPVSQVFEMAEQASALDQNALPALRKAMAHSDSAVRYWGVLGVLMRGKVAVDATRSELRAALSDSSADVRIAAAQTLGQFGAEEDMKKVLALLAEHADSKTHSLFSAFSALNGLDALGIKALPIADQIKLLPTNGPSPNPRYSTYVPRLIEDLTAKLQR